MTRDKAGPWTEDGRAHTATLGASTFRIVQYPEESPMGGKFGVYQDGRYEAALSSLAAAKARCAGLAAKNRNALRFTRSSK